jgi:murein tripeptide amidase MpaA
MSKSIKILILFLLTVSLIGFNYPGQEEFPDTIISMAASDYRAYMKNHPPLDRLYCQGETCFFLVTGMDIKQVEASGAKILAREPVPAYELGFHTPQSDDSTRQGDINGAYHNYIETKTLLQELESGFPGMAQVITIGYSIEGRELNVIKISDNVESDEAEPNIFIVGCHHAREWISVEVPLLFAQYLLENYNDNPQVRRAVNDSQIYILPLQNPDGLEFSIHTYRMWRKNRRYNGNFSWGVDTNRNYGYMWGYDDEGSSPDPNSYTYRGTGPFSEPETEAVRQFLLAHPPVGSLSFHNFSQLILMPWGYTFEPTPDAFEMNEIAGEMADRIYQVSGRVYHYGSSEALYLTNGDTIDWIYGTFGAPAFTIELPPEYMVFGGFFTPEEMIDSAFNENLPALLYFVNYFITGSGGGGNEGVFPRSKSPHTRWKK